MTGTFKSDYIPAFSDSASFMLFGGQLTATSLSTGKVLWTVSGDGTAGSVLASAPIVIDTVVVIGSTSGTVYALDTDTGNVLWSGAAGAPIGIAGGQDTSFLTGLAAGDGYLVVPASGVLNGWRLIP